MLTPHVADTLRQSPYRVVVTGSGGWLGRATLDLLQDALGAEFDKRVHCFGSRRRSLEVSGGISIEQRPLDELSSLSREPSLVLHMAFLTKDRAETMDEPTYRAANTEIRQTVLESLERIGAEAIFVASSGAAEFAEDPSASAPMRLYGALKREDEEAFAAWAGAHAKGAVTPRIFNLSGPHINKLRSYALSSFILDALNGGPILIRAPHDVVRGYVAIRELMSLAFALLLNRKNETIRFDSGGEPMEVGEVAALIAKVLGGCGVKRPARIGGKADVYLGDSASYRLLLEKHKIDAVPFMEQIGETIDFLRRESNLGARQESYA
jgi:nucleoside-diphosphate-sugar epimerase